MARPSDSQAPAQAPPASLSQKVTDHTDYPILFRTYVSKKARGKGRAILEGVGLYTATIDNCFSSNPNNEEVVQDGLTRWCGGKGIQPPTWGVLFDAMEYAEIAQQHIQGLKKSLRLLDSQAPAQAPPATLSQKVTDHTDYLILFRTYVSKKARGKGRAVLEGVGLYTATIDNCFSSNPNNEEVVQDGLTRWCGGKGIQPPTWGVLFDAMEHAEIAQQHIQGLKKSLRLLEGSRKELDSNSQAPAQSPPASLSQKVTDHKDHLMLFRKYVSRKARGKERGVLKGVQLASHTIDECFNDHPLDDEEAVQDGLTRWCEGLGTQPPTWGVLIAAMEHAEIEQHSVWGLKERLGLLEGSKEEAMEKRRDEERSQDMIKFQEQYSEVVRNQASVTLKITKCTTIGPPRIGKTCLKNLLIGREWDVEAGTASTDVMEAPEWVECYSLEEGGAEKPWKLLSAEQQLGELIRAVNSSITSNAQLMTTPSDAPPTTTPRDAPPITTPSDAPPTSIPSDAPPTTTPSDAPPTTTPSDAPLTATRDAPPTTTPSDAPPTTTPSHTEFRTMPISASPPATMRTATQNLSTVQQILDDLSDTVSLEKLQDFLKDKQGKVLGETRLVHFIDTGGQAIYHDVHPVLITSPSVYLVVFSLKDFYRKKNEERLGYFRHELIQRPLRSIYTFGRKTPTEKDHLQLHPEAPKIFIVGTHLDRVCQADAPSSGEEFLQTVHDMIDREIGSKPYHQFVQYNTKGRSFWAVDNTLAGREQSEGVKEYISALRLMVQERTMEMSVKVPLTWMLLRRVMEGKGEQYCKYAELLEQACIRGYVREGSPEKDLDTMLKLFHILGIFYHKVPKGCKKADSLVFIDLGCLYSTTSDFLMAAKEEMEDSQGTSHEDRHQIPTPLAQPNVELTRRKDPSDMSKCQEATYQRPIALRSRDSSTSQKLTQSASIQKDLRGGVESLKVFGRISNTVRDFLFDMHTVLGTLERIVMRVYKEPPEVVLQNLLRIQQGLEEKCSSDDANTLQSKYRILAQEMVFKLMNSVRKVLQSSASEDKKPKLDSIMRDFWCQCRMTRRSIDADDLHHLLLLLTELRIIARLNQPDCYVIPASLPQLRDQITPVAGDIEPLLFTVRSQDRQTYFLPSGLFCCLISELVTGLGWTVEPLGRTHVAFTHEDLTGVVHVVEHESYIEIKLECVLTPPVKEVSICKFVREQMHEKISLMYSTIYDPPNESKFAMVASPESRRAVVGFKCNCGRGPTHTPHFAAYVEDEFESCLRCLLPRPMPTELSPLMDEHLVWFS